jgi:8-oxo-dGTP pyrophosphatase MutT (NUDIX family)
MTALPIEAVIRVESRSHSAVGGRVVAEEVVASTRWLELMTLTYAIQSTESPHRRWDVVRRTTRRGDAAADAVAVFATMSLDADVSESPRILLVRQFRPPMNALCVELPAGLIDAGETPSEAALRELKEETGFIGSVIHVGTPQALSPGLSNETVILVRVIISGQGTAGPGLCESESIEVLSVPLLRLREALYHMENVHGNVIMFGLECLARGIEMGASLMSRPD